MSAERKSFDLGDYVEVKDRIARFYDLFGQGRLVTAEVTLTREPDDQPRVMVKALAYRTPDDPHPGVGYSWMELPGKTSYTKGSEVENAETSAWGRAIGSLGILIDRSIATTNEIDAKKGDRPALRVVEPKAPTHEATADGGLVGKAEIGTAPADFELREEPDGPAISFKLMDGRKGFRVIARGVLAESLALMPRELVIGQRVTCWGRMGTDNFTKGTTTVTYNILDLERIATPDFILPSPDPVQEASVEPVQTPEVQDGASEPVAAPVEASGPAPDVLCGSPSPYSDGLSCALAPGHKGVHKQFEGFGTSWTD